MGISPSDFERLTRRLAGKGEAQPAVEPMAVGSWNRVLGIDPSLRGTGFGLISMKGSEATYGTGGTIRCPRTWPRSRCLAHIATTMREVIAQQKPEVCAVEGLFFAQNLRTAITLGEARGAALAVVAEAGLPIFEMATRQVKQALVGFGGAQKVAVAKMVQRLLSLAELPESDAADALAVALAFVHTSRRRGTTRLRPL